jgi:hypothetical protein
VKRKGNNFRLVARNLLGNIKDGIRNNLLKTYFCPFKSKTEYMLKVLQSALSSLFGFGKLWNTALKIPTLFIVISQQWGRYIRVNEVRPY